MKKTIFAVVLLFAVFFLAGCVSVPNSSPVSNQNNNQQSTNNSASNITNFIECAAAGNPVMESYPRQCNANGQNFVEEIIQPVMTEPLETELVSEVVATPEALLNQ